MRAFLTGATGFVGAYLVTELIEAGHHVVALCRSDAGAEALSRVGVEVFRGDVTQLDRLRNAAEAADGVIHAAFKYGFSKVHDTRKQGRISSYIQIALQQGLEPYPGEGNNRWLARAC